MTIQSQCMIGDLKAAFMRNLYLAFFDFGIKEFFYLAAIEANKVVMV